MEFFKKIKDTANKICNKTRLDKKTLLIVILFVSGVVLLTLSEIYSSGKKEEIVVATTETYSADDYSLMLEERLSSIISAIDGVGAVRVMVTVESTGEEVYLNNFDYGEDADPNGANSFEQKNEYVIVNNGDAEDGIIVKVRQPEIRGVAVVCQGASDERVKAEIIQTVTALLDVSSARVSVAEMG